MSFYFSVSIDRCSKTDKDTLEKITSKWLCIICKQIPLSLIRDKENQNNIYCEECAIKNKISSRIKATKEETALLKMLVIDCSRFCGKTFKFSELNDLDDHESICGDENQEEKEIELNEMKKREEQKKMEFLNKKEKPKNDKNKFDEKFDEMKKNNDFGETQKSELCKDCNNELEEEHDCLKTMTKKIKDTINIVIHHGDITQSKLSELNSLYDVLNKKSNSAEENINSLKLDVLKFKNDIGRNPIIQGLIEKVEGLDLKMKNKGDSNENNNNSNIDEYKIYLNKLSLNVENMDKKIKLLENESNIKLENHPVIEKINMLIKELTVRVESGLYSENSPLGKKIKNIESELNNQQIQFEKSPIIQNLNKKIQTLFEKAQNFNNFNDSKIENNSEESEFFGKNYENLRNELKILQTKIEEVSSLDFVKVELNKKLNMNNYSKLSKIKELLINYQTKAKEILVVQNSIKCDLNFDNEYKEYQKSYDELSIQVENESFQNNHEEFMKKLNKSISDQQYFGNEQFIMKGHKYQILCMLSYKLDKLITSSKDKSIKLWDLSKKSCIGTIENAHKNWVTAIIILRNTNILVSGGLDFKIKFWNILTLKEEAGDINNDESPVSVLIQYSNTMILSSNTNYNIHFYDINARCLIKKIKTGHDGLIRKIVLIQKENDTIMITGSEDKMIKVWENEKNTLSLDGHKGTVQSMIQLNTDKNILVSADNYGNIIFWDINSYFHLLKKIRRIEYYNEGNDNTFDAYLYELKHLNILVSSSGISTLSFWNLTDYSLIRNLEVKFGITCVTFSKNEGGLVFNIGTDIVLWR